MFRLTSTHRLIDWPPPGRSHAFWARDEDILCFESGRASILPIAEDWRRGVLFVSRHIIDDDSLLVSGRTLSVRGYRLLVLQAEYAQRGVICLADTPFNRLRWLFIKARLAVARAQGAAWYRFHHWGWIVLNDRDVTAWHWRWHR